MSIPGPRPRTHAEFMRRFNPFIRWMTVWEVEVRPGVWLQETLAPEHYPPNWWWECECGKADPG
jgi:hypothetical protein